MFSCYFVVVVSSESIYERGEGKVGD